MDDPPLSVVLLLDPEMLGVHETFDPVVVDCLFAVVEMDQHHLDCACQEGHQSFQEKFLGSYSQVS